MCSKLNSITPCVTKTPKNKSYYKENNGIFTCKYKFPDITPYEEQIIDIYNMCGRDYMMEYCRKENITNIEDLIYLAHSVELELSKNKDNRV